MKSDKDNGYQEQDRETLIKNLEMFKVIFDYSTEGILIADTEENKFFMANDAICSMLGYTKEELLGLSIKDIHPEVDLPHVNEQFKRQAMGELVVAEDLPVMRKDRTVFYADISSKAIRLSGKEYVAGIFQDITERKKAIELLKKERYRAQKYLDIAGVMLIVINEKGEIDLINEKGCEILGYSNNEIVSKNWFDLCIHEDIREEIYAVFNKLMGGDIEVVEYYENAIINKNGESRIIAFHNTLIKNEESRITGILFSGEDITDRKKAEDELKARTEELERINQAFVGRELKMVELKNEIKELKKKNSNA